MKPLILTLILILSLPKIILAQTNQQPLPLSIFQNLTFQQNLSQQLEALPEDQRTPENLAKIFQQANRSPDLPLIGSLEINPDNDRVATGSTGLTGRISARVTKGEYQLSVQPIDNFQIIIPPTVKVGPNQDRTVYLGLRQGKGILTTDHWQVKVRRFFVSLKQKLFSIVKAQETLDPPRPLLNNLNLQLFHDKNGNGLKETEETIVPWADFSLELTRTTDIVKIDLSYGWNLVSIPINPIFLTTTSDIMKSITLDGGYAITVASWDHDHWREAIRRGLEDFSIDFETQPGHVYLINNTQPITWEIAGHQLEQPISFDLKPGWNTLAIPFSSQEYHALDIINQLNSTNCQSADSCTPEELADSVTQWQTGTWDVFVKRLYTEIGIQQYGNNFSISPTQGYMIRVNQDLTFTPK